MLNIKISCNQCMKNKKRLSILRNIFEQCIVGSTQYILLHTVTALVLCRVAIFLWCSHMHRYPKAPFVLHCNTFAFTNISFRPSIYHCSCNILHFHFLAVLQCRSLCRDGNLTTATHCNTDAMEYEQNLTQ